MGGTQPVSNKNWEAEEDVRTLIRAQEVLDDPKRRKQALVEIKKQNKATDKAQVQLLAKTGKRLKKVFGKK